MKKIGLFCLAICIIFSITPLCMANDGSNDISVPTQPVNSCNGLDAATALLNSGQIVENADAVLMYDLATNTLVYQWNADASMPPSSLVKIMTAYLALQKGDPEDVITVKESTLSTIPKDAASVYLLAGEQITLSELIYCMLVGSANDAAAVIAEHISGTQEAFVQEMNTVAQSMGCTGTYFVNCHGLHNDAQYTTARDVARILSAALQNETFRAAFTTVHYTVNATNMTPSRELAAGNFLMNTDSMEIYYDERVTGGRTGIANDGKRSLAITAESNGMELITVLIGAESEIAADGYSIRVYGGFNEIKTLLDHAFDGYEAVEVLYDGQTLYQTSVINGTNDVFLGPNEAVKAILPSATRLTDLTLKIENIQELKAPIELGQHLSHVEVWHQNLCLAEADLYAKNSVPSALETFSGDVADQNITVWTVLLHIFLWAVAIGVIGVCIYLATPRIRRLFQKRKSKKYRRSRRRSQ